MNIEQCVRIGRDSQKTVRLDYLPRPCSAFLRAFFDSVRGSTKGLSDSSSFFFCSATRASSISSSTSAYCYTHLCELSSRRLRTASCRRTNLEQFGLTQSFFLWGQISVACLLQLQLCQAIFSMNRSVSVSASCTISPFAAAAFLSSSSWCFALSFSWYAEVSSNSSSTFAAVSSAMSWPHVINCDHSKVGVERPFLSHHRPLLPASLR